MKKHRKIFFDFLRAIEVLAIVGGVMFAILQIQDSRNTNYGLTSLEVTKELYTKESYPNNPKIIKALHSGDLILKSSVAEEDLNNFLGLMEWIENAKKVGILNDEIIYQMFSVDIIDAYNNKEIQDFINQSRAYYKDDRLFSGFGNLSERMINHTNKELRELKK